MKSLAVVMAINIILCGVFTLTNGLTCYICDLDDKQCATELSDSNLKSNNCTGPTGAAPAPGGNAPQAPAGDAPPAPAGDAPPAAAGDAPPASAPDAAATTAAAADEATTAAALMFRRRRSNGTLNMYHNKISFIETAGLKYYCFKASVKANASAEPTVVRGCKLTNDTKDCLKVPAGATVESCSVCDKDNCNGNGQSIVTGSEVQCALMSSLVIAWMFLQTK